MAAPGTSSLQEPLLSEGRQDHGELPAEDSVPSEFHVVESSHGKITIRPLLLLPLASAIGLSLRLLLIATGMTSALESRIEISTPLNSWSRLQEGLWLMSHSLSPYSTEVYHSSPLLLHFCRSLPQTSFSVLAALIDVATALLLHRTVSLALSHRDTVPAGTSVSRSGVTPEAQVSSCSGYSSSAAAATAALCHLLNPLRIASSTGATTAPISDFFVVSSLLAATCQLSPLSAFCWVMASHLSPPRCVLFIPLLLLLGRQDRTLYSAPSSARGTDKPLDQNPTRGAPAEKMSATAVLTSAVEFIFWAVLWSFFLVQACASVLGVPLSQAARVLWKNAAFEYNTRDLTPNWGLRWYFFSEVFPEVRGFFSFVFSACLLLVAAPLTIRLHRRPLFLAFALLAFANLVAAYPCASDHGLVLSLLPMFMGEMSEMRGGFVVLLGFVYTATMGPIMFDLWCLKGIGNANFYYAVTLIFAASQGLFNVQSVWAHLLYEFKNGND